MDSDPVVVIARLVRAFEELEVPYLVGGSFASSVYGVPRATQDVDVVAGLTESKAADLRSRLSDEFYVDADMALEAVRRRGSFNVVHLGTLFKADIFVTVGDEWSREEMARARVEELPGPDGPLAVRFASPEDTVLHKLVWYRLGDEVSDRQWSDILGILRIQAGLLDDDYLDLWAPRLGVVDLLARARTQTGS